MRRSILVVEDEALVRQHTIEMLKAAGLDAVGFDSAGDALAYARNHAGRVAAIFTDIYVEGTIDGVELASRVAREHPEIVLLVTSGRCGGEPAGLPSNATFLRKPWLPLQVIKAMQDAVCV